MATIADYASAYVSKYGFAIVPLPPKSKRPVEKEWGGSVLTDKHSARKFYEKNPTANMGVALGPSRICSWDIDDEPAARMICDEFGFDIDAMRAAVPTIQGQAPGFRMMFRIPDGVDLPYHSLTWPKQDGSSGRFTVFELRAACDGQQRQDVLPPSIHPDTGQPYQWLTRPNGKFPEPPDWLLTIWREWDKFKPQLIDVCPWAEKRNLTPPPPAAPRTDGTTSVIDAYVASTPITAALKDYGYKPAGKRWLSPHSSTKLPGVCIFDDGRAWIHHASDPLCSDESGRPVNSFDLFCYYEHNGDASKAVKAAANQLCLKLPPRERKLPPPPPNVDPETGEIVPPKATVGNGASSTTTRLPASDAAASEDRPPAVPATTAGGSGVTAVDWISILEGNKNGPLNNLDNAVRVLEHDPSIIGRIWYDEFLDRIVTTWQGPEREWKDADDLKLQLYLQRYVGMTKIGVQSCHDAALVAAFHNIRNECKDYLNGQTWDCVPRLNAMLHEAFGAEDNAYSEAVGRCWFISMVARVFNPGCKVDTVPVLEGTQGRGKSTALSIIGGKWYVECHESVTSKDFYGVLDGHLLVEIAEMHSFTRAEVERIKGIISCQKDRYRKSYGRNTEDHPRKTVLACTTNRDDWQRDDTGARRFWPIHCGEINHDWLRTHRDQLFAEAVALYREGTPWWDVPTAAQQDEVEKRREVDSWEPIIEEWVAHRDRFQTHNVLAECLQIDIAKHDKVSSNRVARILRLLGFDLRPVRGHDGKQKKAWVKR